MKIDMKTKLITTLTALLMLVNVADVTYLVDLIMKQSTSGYYWYFGVGDLTETDVPSAPIYTYDNQGLGWYILDTSVNSFTTPTAKLNNDRLPWIIALPVASGFNDARDGLGSILTDGLWQTSYLTINGVQYLIIKQDDEADHSTKLTLTITKKQ